MKFNSIIRSLILLATTAFVFACGSKEEVDLIVFNANVYTVDGDFSKATAFAVKDGKFVAVGNDTDILLAYKATDEVDAEGSPIYPGLIDGHAHFYRYGLGLAYADLGFTKSFDELVARVIAHREKYPDAPWIIGRGWDQNAWPGQAFPKKDTFDILFPDTPLLLTRVDGHAALANSAALKLGGVTAQTKMIGGKVIVENNEPTGVLVDNAIDLVSEQIPEPDTQESVRALLMAQENCFRVGLTTVVDAGLDRSTIELMDSLHKAGSFKMRIYAMINPTQENKDYYFKNGHYITDQLTVRSFKIYGDGALGSRGASLLAPYHDDPDNSGFLLSEPETFESLANEMYANGFQMNTHCIGDSANRTLLDIYGRVLKGKNDLRWRIEHAQIVTRADIDKFAAYSIIPSVQPTHATSDMYWAEDRLGPDRIKTAYTFKDLLDQNGTIALGSDFPVEDINPMYGFHSAVARRDAKNWPEEGFQMENKLSREEALKGTTIWAAHANFEEDKKGSIEVGKLADFVIFQEDIMELAYEKLRDAKVKNTYVSGQRVY